MVVWVIGVIGLVLISLEGSVLHLLDMSDLSLQISLVLVSYAALRRDLASSMMWMLVWLLPMDWCAGGPAGLHAFGLVVAFWALRTVAQRFERQWNVGKVLLTGVAAIVYHLAIILVFVITDPDSPILDAVWYTTLHNALTASAVSVVLGFMLGRVEQSLRAREGHDGLTLS